MTSTTSSLIGSPYPRPAALRVLDDDALEDVRGGLGRVYRPLQDGEDVLPADDDHGVDPVREQRCHGVAGDAVAVVLETVDLYPVVIKVLEPAQVGERAVELI